MYHFREQKQQGKQIDKSLIKMVLEPTTLELWAHSLLTEVTGKWEEVTDIKTLFFALLKVVRTYHKYVTTLIYTRRLASACVISSGAPLSGVIFLFIVLKINQPKNSYVFNVEK